MDSQFYVLIGIIVFAIIAVVVILNRKKVKRPLSRLAWFAFVFVLAGIIFNSNQYIGYGLMGIGVILAIIDIIKKEKLKKLEK